MALISVDAGGLGRFMRVNKALCDLSGYARDELERSEVETLTHGEDLEHAVAAMARLLAGGSEGYQLEERLVHAESHAIWVLVSTTLVRDAAGEPLYCIRQVQDIEERKRFEGQLGFLADHDPLTGLYNRRRFVRELSQRMAYARRYGSGGAVLFLDIDDFKYVNDTLGHKTGDEVISAVGCIVQQRVRVTDVLARLGGDEFGVLLPEASEEEAQILARGLAAAVREGSAPLVGEGRPHVTVSVGVSAFDRPRGELTADDILVEADLAMYAAKEDGRDRVALSSSEHKERMRARINWTERLSRAVEDDHFVLYCQPILDLSSGSVSQHELLLRLRGEGELILPASFLYTAERFGSILALDRWVLSRGMRLIAEQRAAGRQLRLEINLSGRSVTDPQLPEFIEQELEATAIDPASLVLEVTETAAIANMDQARRFAARLGEIGCGFALDDFGAGFGSFYYLKHIPFDYVKIDGEFIRHLPASSTDQLILESIVGMCKGLGKRTIAEFVGDEKTVEVLREHDVDYAQGYHVGRPRPLNEALAT
jgi:diguanylate cyclase (GGDEF)-like protein/PAS domain S-box-containing protein